MNKKKTIAVSIVLLLVLLIGGMLAYFTDTDTATNVFTLGDDIEILLTESTPWTNTANTTEWTNDNAEGLHPGAVVAKDPTVKNESTTTPAYVFATVTVPCYDADANGTVETPLFSLNGSSGTALGTSAGSAGNSGWTLIQVSSVNTTDKTITYLYAYGSSSTLTSLAESADAQNLTSTGPIFSSVTLNSTLTSTQAATASANPNIVVNAYGIQTDGVGTAPATVWALFGVTI